MSIFKKTYLAKEVVELLEDKEEIVSGIEAHVMERKGKKITIPFEPETYKALMKHEEAKDIYCMLPLGGIYEGIMRTIVEVI